jgi:hypothetical protein
VSLDVSALLATQRAIKVAKADYDFARDGGAGGIIAIATEAIPDGSFVVGYAIHTSAAFTFAGGGSFYFLIGSTLLAAPHATLDYIIAALMSGVAAVLPNADRGMAGYVAAGTVTAGAATIWVFYLPLVD